MKKWIIGGAVSLVIIAGAAGSYTVATAGPSEQEQRAQARYEQALKNYRRDVREWERKQADAEACRSAFTELVDQAQEITGRIGSGMYLDDYVTSVGDLASAYQGSGYEDVDFGCLSAVGLPLEEAVNKHQKALTKWDDCQTDLYCDIDTGGR